MQNCGCYPANKEKGEEEAQGNKVTNQLKKTWKNAQWPRRQAVDVNNQNEWNANTDFSECIILPTKKNTRRKQFTRRTANIVKWPSSKSNHNCSILVEIVVNRMQLMTSNLMQLWTRGLKKHVKFCGFWVTPWKAIQLSRSDTFWALLSSILFQFASDWEQLVISSLV